MYVTFGRYMYIRPPFSTALAAYVVLIQYKVQYKIDDIFQELHNIFGIADDILIVGYDDDGKDHDRILR